MPPIRRDVARRTTLARKAWTEQRPELLIEPGPDTLVVVRTPDGRARTRGDLVEDLRRRMAMVTRIDTLREEVDSIRTMADSAVVFTSQRFVRWLRLDGGEERQRISSVIHRQNYRREGKRWRSSGPLQEMEPKAYWADEGPPSP